MLGFFSSEAMGTCSFCTSGLYHAGVLAPFPGGLGLEVPSQLLSCLLWGRQPGGFAPTSIWLQFGSS